MFESPQVQKPTVRQVSSRLLRHENAGRYR